MYNLKFEYIPYLYFPNVNTVALLNCSATSIPSLLKPEIFPHLKKIHYLSLHPGMTTIYKRFDGKDVQWIFPNRKYEFYNYMQQAGLGGIDPDLITTYIHSSESINGSTHFNLNIPGYGTASGQWYKDQLYYYFTKVYRDPYALHEPIKKDKLIDASQILYVQNNKYSTYYKTQLKQEYFNHLLRDNKPKESS